LPKSRCHCGATKLPEKIRRHSGRGAAVIRNLPWLRDS
jgi:hypothetical protein